MPLTEILQDPRASLVNLMETDALQRGDFTLASGKRANYYLDCRKITLHPQGAQLIGHQMLDVITTTASQTGVMPAAVGGMAIGADPITASIVTIAGGKGDDLRGFMVRKESKGHGMKQQVEGPVEPGQKVVVVEDVITSGGSAIKAVEAAREFGLDVLYVLAIIDRLAGGREAFERIGLELKTLTTIRDFGIEPN
ncbi:MAG: orotate phosphoribosyltransferase [Planctomycetota bacterium]